MAEKDRDDALDKLSLDKPKLFGRRKNKAPEPVIEAGPREPQPEPEAVVEPEPVVEAPEAAPVVEAPAPPPVVEAARPRAAAPFPPPDDDTRRFAPPEPSAEPSPQPVTATPEPAAEPVHAPAPEAVAEPAPSAQGDPATDTSGGERSTGAVAGALGGLGSLAGGVRRRVAARSTRTDADGGPRERWTPPVAGVQAVAIVGLAVGVLVYGLSLGTLKACETFRGTSSCGSAGYLYLAAILVIAALVGGWALDRCSIADPRGTAMLAVGILSVVVLLILVPVLFSWTMVLVIPLVSTLAFLGSHAIAGVDLEAGERWQPEDDNDALGAPVIAPPAQHDRHDAGLGGRP